MFDNLAYLFIGAILDTGQSGKKSKTIVPNEHWKETQTISAAMTSGRRVEESKAHGRGEVPVLPTVSRVSDSARSGPRRGCENESDPLTCHSALDAESMRGPIGPGATGDISDGDRRNEIKTRKLLLLKIR